MHRTIVDFTSLPLEPCRRYREYLGWNCRKEVTDCKDAILRGSEGHVTTTSSRAGCTNTYDSTVQHSLLVLYGSTVVLKYYVPSAGIGMPAVTYYCKQGTEDVLHRSFQGVLPIIGPGGTPRTFLVQVLYEASLPQYECSFVQETTSVISYRVRWTL